MDGESLANRRRIGLLGGTFDPPHVGHLIAARAVAHELNLDEVRFVVAGEPWQKAGTDVTPSATRLEMVRRAVEGIEGLAMSKVEVDRPGPSYSSDTLEELTRTEPDVDWFFIVGSDAAQGLDTWDRPQVIADLATLVVVARPPRIEARPPHGWAHEIVSAPLVDLSSTELRERFRSGRPVDWLVPANVITYVVANDIYGVGR